MSAYLVNPEQLGIMVSVFGNESQYADKDSCNYYENQIDDLADANLMSIGRRYEGVETSRMKTEEKIRVCEKWLSIGYGEYLVRAYKAFESCQADHMGKWKKHTNPVQILKYCRNYAYQSCEFDGWKKSAGHRVMDWVSGRAMDKLEGYEEALWGYESDEQLAEWAKREEVA